MDSDEELARESGEGRQEAFATLYDRYFHRLYDYARRLVRDDDEAADVAQVAFLKAYQALARSVEPPTSFRSWLFAIAHHEAIDRLRHHRFTPGDDEEKLARLADASLEAEPETVAERQDQARWVWRAMGGLRAEEQEILLLNVREGMDAGEIAQTLGKRRETVRVLLSRARDSFEDSFTTLLLLSRGQRDCSELAALGTVHDVSTQLRRDVRRHVAACDVCQRNRQRYSTAAEILGGLAPVPVAVEVKGALWNQIAEQIGRSDLRAGSSLLTGGGQAHSEFWRRWEERWRRRWVGAAIAALLLLLIGFVGISATGGVAIFQAPSPPEVGRADEPRQPTPGRASVAVALPAMTESGGGVVAEARSIEEEPPRPEDLTAEDPEMPGDALEEDAIATAVAVPTSTPTAAAQIRQATAIPASEPIQREAPATLAPEPTAPLQESESDQSPDPVPPAPTAVSQVATPGPGTSPLEGEPTATAMPLTQSGLGTPTPQSPTPVPTATAMPVRPTPVQIASPVAAPTTAAAVVPTASSVQAPAPPTPTPSPAPTATPPAPTGQPATPTRGAAPTPG